jgi:hypothetical protein
LARAAISDNYRLIVVAVAAFAVLWGLLLPHGPVDRTSGGVLVWWTALCAVSVFNVCGWHLSAAAVARRKGTSDPAVHRLQRWQLVLSAVFVLGCGFRSILPRADVQRIGLFDSWLSSVAVGRSVATVAELCFMAQWALLLHKLAEDAGSRLGVVVSRLALPLIAVAELCSWYAVLTTFYFGNVLEESIWALTASLLIVTGLALWSRCSAPCRPFLAAALALGVAYVAFMCAVDVPMYVARWQADQASGRAYLSLAEGFRDVCFRRTVTMQWEEWRPEIPWMSLYFSVGVWCSIALVHVPGWLQSRDSSQVTATPLEPSPATSPS